MKLVLHPNTQNEAQNFLNNPSHALLIEGQIGSGKGALATQIASQLLQIEPDTLVRYPFFQLITPTEKVISIDAIRSAQQFMRLKTLGKSSNIRRVLVVENAQTLTIEAQNAFLKLLEEPPEDTVIIMTVINQSDLLPTIRSRTQHLRIVTPLKDNLEKHFLEQGYQIAEIETAYRMSEGNSGLMHALLANDSELPLVAQIKIAKMLLSLTVFERLIMSDQFTEQRSEAEHLVSALQLVCHAGLSQSAQRGQVEVMKRWHKSLHKLTEADKSLRSNPNLKLLTTDLLMSL